MVSSEAQNQPTRPGTENTSVSSRSLTHSESPQSCRRQTAQSLRPAPLSFQVVPLKTRFLAHSSEARGNPLPPPSPDSLPLAGSSTQNTAQPSTFALGVQNLPNQSLPNSPQEVLECRRSPTGPGDHVCPAVPFFLSYSRSLWGPVTPEPRTCDSASALLRRGTGTMSSRGTTKKCTFSYPRMRTPDASSRPRPFPCPVVRARGWGMVHGARQGNICKHVSQQDRCPSYSQTRAP